MGMVFSDSDIDGPSAPAVVTPAFGSIAIATGLLTTLGAWGRVHGTLNKWRSCLGLNLRDRLGGVLRQGYGYRGLERRNLHTVLRLTSTIRTVFSHMRNEEIVNCNKVNLILNKCFQISLLDKALEQGVQP